MRAVERHVFSSALAARGDVCTMLGRVMRRIDLRGWTIDSSTLAHVLPRAALDITAAADQVRPVVEAVRARGAAAIAEFTERFDGVRPASLAVPRGAMRAALTAMDASLREALTEAITRTRRVHAAQVPTGGTVQVTDGGRVTQRWIPVRRVGLYVPGGLAVYPSSVVMNVVPAQEAGVSSIAVACPPRKDSAGWPHASVLATCELLGVHEVYAVGGAQAIAMLAHGVTDDAGRRLVEPVDVITGPGNVWVQAAKRLVMGTVGIDAEAGPTEIAILADAGANPDYVAADLVSQAEHDPLAASVLITNSPDLADAVDKAVARRSAATLHAERVAVALTGPQSGIILVDSLDAGLCVVNAYAAEHLEIQTAHAADVARRVHSAGAIFVGPASPVPLGDYLAGSNHVLPTGGTARFASGLNATSFLKSVQQIDYTVAALAEATEALEVLSRAEDLPAHGESARARSPGVHKPPS
ncbi:MAG: histidinol dehydrogenase [Bifidobacteriaceae bacterium]|jgi:histidinol dehydrogenase|nr:histidinol dehydrogenase [Bifidobacteriaceae bacterium]